MDILEAIYYGNLSEYDRRIDKDILEIEDKAYKEMLEKLPEEYVDIVREYVDKSADYIEKLCLQKYKRGFKIGMLIALESTNLDI